RAEYGKSQKQLVEGILDNDKTQERVQRAFKFRAGKTVILYDNDGGSIRRDEVGGYRQSYARWRDQLAVGFLREGAASR
ncbi:unnamed protein product, partial [Heterosigma akashiwo]